MYKRNLVFAAVCDLRVDGLCTVAEILAERVVKLYIHPSHNVPGNATAK